MDPRKTLAVLYEKHGVIAAYRFLFRLAIRRYRAWRGTGPAVRFWDAIPAPESS